MATTTLNIRIDKELKKQAENLFSDLGLNMTSAITVFLKAAVDHNGIPFEIKKTERSLTVSDAELLSTSSELITANKEAYRSLIK